MNKLETKKIENKDVLPEGVTVTITKFSYGITKVIQGKTFSVKSKGDEHIPDFNTGNMMIYNLVYGIYECEHLGIVKPKSSIGILDSFEEQTRFNIVFSLPKKVGDWLYREINDYNNLKDSKDLAKN
jgi:hypothetical protein